jgi:hypothetical protein
MSSITERLDEKTNERIYNFACPHCEGIVEVKHSELNCRIFRHGTLKSTGQQISPHAPKDECDRLVQGNLVNGCARPFKFTGTVVEVCGYI